MVWKECYMPKWCRDVWIQKRTKGFNIPVYFKGKHYLYKAIWKDGGADHWSIYDYVFYRRLRR